LNEGEKKDLFPTDYNTIQTKLMKQIQNIVPQNAASRKSHYSAPTRRPDPPSCAQIQGQIPPSKQKTERGEEASAETGRARARTHTHTQKARGA
jgi:hypothetical protein